MQVNFLLFKSLEYISCATAGEWRVRTHRARRPQPTAMLSRWSPSTRTLLGPSGPCWEAYGGRLPPPLARRPPKRLLQSKVRDSHPADSSKPNCIIFLRWGRQSPRSNLVGLVWVT